VNGVAMWRFGRGGRTDQHPGRPGDLGAQPVGRGSDDVSFWGSKQPRHRPVPSRWAPIGARAPMPVDGESRHRLVAPQPPT